jgi:hypothetical protein
VAYQAIECYGVIGDVQTAGLVGTNGSIDCSATPVRLAQRVRRCVRQDSPFASERNRGYVPSRSSPCSGARLRSWSAPLGRRALTSISGSERVGSVAEVDG